MELKDTLLMLKTSFEMKGNLTTKEPLTLEKWREMDLYNLIQKKNQKNPTFTFHDGPPYANGSMHIGHALNKSLKDFIVKYKSMCGYNTPHIPGWDTHGLPIEHAIQKSGVNRADFSILEYRKKCEDYAREQVAIQQSQLEKLGLTTDFTHKYLTLDKEVESEQIKVFAKMALEGAIYKGLKPVYWSPASQSALAEAEIEYADHESTSIYVKFKVKDGKNILLGDESFVIWTTTPWTIPANLAICLNENLEYGVYETSKGVLIFLTSLADTLKEKMQLENLNLRKTFKGKQLELITTIHPLYSRDSLVILGDHVTSEAGTGCVHTAPGHGEDDFIVGKKYNLGVLSPVDEKGKMTIDAGEFVDGIFYEKANDLIVNKLEEVGALLAQNKFIHSYPHDWRYKKPVIFRATPQWFASIEKNKEKMLEEITKVKWLPNWGEVRLYNMIKDRVDWCISRQRIWGVPIPIIYNEDDSPIIDEKVFNHIADLFEKHGSSIWYQLEATELLPEGYHNNLSPNNKFRKELDIMDVWFDSGCSHTTVMKKRGYKYPSDLYLEGSDQYRGWFNSSLITGVYFNSTAPYKSVVTHGMVLDGQGNKMSKSLGNSVDPNAVVKQYGADILRLWVASVDYFADVRISDSIIKQTSEVYRKIRNTFRFLIGNLAEYQKPKILEITENIDKYILARFEEVKFNCRNSYENYLFANVITEIINFMSFDLSSFYLDITKDVLYCNSKNDLRRKQIQNVLYIIFDDLLRLIAPIIPFTAEEIYNHHPIKEVASVHLLDMAKAPIKLDEKLLKEYHDLMNFRSEVLKKLELARQEGIIGSSLEAVVEINFSSNELKKLFESLGKVEMRKFLIVSSIKIENNLEKETNVIVTRHNGIKCPRCWNYFDKEDVSEDGLCSRCQEVVKEYE